MLLENWVIFTSSIILSFYFLLLGLLQCAVAISPSLFCFFFFELFKMALSFSLCSDRLTPVMLALSLPSVLHNSCKDEFGRVNVFNRNAVNRS